jgi:phosphoadenosine phosphosulfate reductase
MIAASRFPLRLLEGRTMNQRLGGDAALSGTEWNGRATPIEIVSAAEADVERLTAEEVLRWAHEEFGDKLCVTCSWQKQSSVLVHMVANLGLEVDVVELDTHLFFRETYETRDRLIARYGLTLVRPDIITVAEQHRQEGPNLWERDPDRCCHIRKVEPLIRALEPYDAWITGLRRDQSPSRAGLRKVERSERYGVWKIAPLAGWSEDDVWRYIAANDIPYNRLHDVGYRSIGCIPCTRPTRPDEEERAGRWAGADKLECGIHVERERATSRRAESASRETTRVRSR